MADLIPHRSGVYEDIYFPPDLDEDWCSMFIQAHHRGDLRVVLQSPYYYAKQSDYSCRMPSSRTQYEKVLVADPDSEGLLFDGRIHGARMMPVSIESDDGRVQRYNVPHAIMTEVVHLTKYETEAPRPVSDDMSERLFIPLVSIFGSVTLYAAWREEAAA